MYFVIGSFLQFYVLMLGLNFQFATFDPRFLLENPNVTDMLASNCDSRCKALIRLKYGIWVSRQEAEIRLIPVPTTTSTITSTIYTVSTTTTTITSMSTTAVTATVPPESPSLSFGDYLAIGGNYVVTFLVFMGQFASYLYHHYTQVG